VTSSVWCLPGSDPATDTHDSDQKGKAQLDVAQLGRAPGLGPGRREFESLHPDWWYCSLRV
jgi:hypothetical protein